MRVSRTGSGHDLALFAQLVTCHPCSNDVRYKSPCPSGNGHQEWERCKRGKELQEALAARVHKARVEAITSLAHTHCASRGHLGGQYSA